MTSKQSRINQSFIRCAREPTCCTVVLQPVLLHLTHHFAFLIQFHFLLKPEAFSHFRVVIFPTVVFWMLRSYSFPLPRSRLFNFLTCQSMKTTCHMSRGRGVRMRIACIHSCNCRMSTTHGAPNAASVKGMTKKHSSCVKDLPFAPS